MNEAAPVPEVVGIETPALRRRHAADIAIVVPVYGHGVLVADALDSILAQPDLPRVLGVVVDDGCPHPETHWSCLEYAAAHPDRIVYLQHANQGSAAARNAAIEWALSRIDGLEAIYFLDADNMLVEGGLANAWATLHAQGADFVYPPYTATGLHREHEQVNPFSATWLLSFNFIDTGSLVHRRVFDAGLRFDPDVKGFEDWDFWLSAVEHGFRGAYEPDLGLLYRKRPESQLTDHDLVRREAMAEILHKHQRLYHPASQIALAASERTRYAVSLIGSRRVLFANFVNEPGRVVPRSELERRLWASLLRDCDHDVPAFHVWIDDDLWASLEKVGLLGWLLVDAERALRSARVYGVCFAAETDLGELEIVEGGLPRGAGMIVLRGDVVKEAMVAGSTAWIESAVMAAERPAFAVLRTVRLPRSERLAVRRVATAVVDDVAALQTSAYRASATVPWHVRPPAVVPAARRFALLTEPYADAAPLPYRPTGKDVVFVLPFAEFGGADRVSYNMAHAMRAEGWTPHLVVTNRNRIRLPAEFADTFETIAFVDDVTATHWGGGGFYFGTALPGWGADGRWVELWELVWFSAIFVNNHSAVANTVAGRLKKLGVATFTHLHLVDVDALGGVSGHPMLALAYERAYTGLLGCSKAICDWLVAEGAPRAKVMEIRNGPGFLVSPERARAVAAARAERDGERLAVLYLGRLDHQKGLDALIDVHRRAVAAEMPLDWRFVGDAMVDGGAAALDDDFRAAIEPAVFDADDVIAALDWADVILLLSDYEGLPLVLVEAMLLGVVPIATDVGAIGELITDGRDGFLVDVAHRERDALRCLDLLSRDRRRLREASAAAQATGAARNDWAAALAPLRPWLHGAAADGAPGPAGSATPPEA